MSLSDLEGRIHEHTYRTLALAEKHCNELLRTSAALVNQFCKQKKIPLKRVCFAITGSVGRQEALRASDLDLLPILKDSKAMRDFEAHDSTIRQLLEDKLRVKVSEGKDLTKAVTLEELTNQETIGGDDDDSAYLTKRVLILTESAQAGGELSLSQIRRELLQAYSEQERTSGRNVQSLNNDIARYFRTLCIEYKAKVDAHSKDWCTRNAKLRHSRKFWYFSTMLAIVVAAQNTLYDNDGYVDRLLGVFEMPPYKRLITAMDDTMAGLTANVLESYGFFLDFMSVQERRDSLAKVKHEMRHTIDIQNPFPLIKKNSDLMHHAMIHVIDALPAPMRHRLFDWFLL